MARKKQDKLVKKRHDLVIRTSAAIGTDAETVTELLSLERKQSLRVNTLKVADDAIERLRELGWHGSRYDWTDAGYTIDQGLKPVRDSELVADGLVYIQNAASWLPVLALDPQPSESVLDVCAAPGGKTSHIAAITKNKALITANDNSRPRLAKLRANLDRLGVGNVELTLYDATQIARKLHGRQFDKILLDAPCSGEGMMRYDNDKDFESWSVAHIKRLQQLQKRLILQAWQLLRPGGTLVYSTCTMAPEENEAVIDYLLRKAPEAIIEPISLDLPNRSDSVTAWNGKEYSSALVSCLRLRPSEHIEAFFVCKISKSL